MQSNVSFCTFIHVVVFIFSVLRARGHFGNVSIHWRLFANDSVTPLNENQEFINTSGFITFTTGEKSKPIILEAISDKLPEFNEFFVLRLINISGEFTFSFLTVKKT